MSTIDNPQPAARPLHDIIRELVSKQQYELWFSSIEVLSASADGVQIAVANPFIRDWLSTYYAEVLRAAVRSCVGADAPLELTLAAQPEAELSPLEAAASALPAPELARDNRAFFATHSDVVLNEKYTFENFVVGPSNSLAHAAARAVGDAPSHSYNPLFLHGRVGMGKTHLLQAICQQALRSRKSQNILYLSSETFVNQFIAAIEKGDVSRFRYKYRSVDILLVDDIHLLAHKDRTQEEFFHTFNALYNAGKQIVLSSDSPPQSIPSITQRLISRFKWGLEAELEPPGYETRLAILRRKARDRGVEVPEEVLRLLGEQVDTNIRELEGAITKVIGYGQLIHREIDIDLAHQALGMQPGGSLRPVTGVDRVIDVVCKHFGVRSGDLQGRRRTQSIALPRQAAMYLARQLTSMSLEEIGGCFGGRDHSTVLYAVDKIRSRMVASKPFSLLMADLETRAQH
ncbi:MAG TPA: chromosomal replication initiator protein DnaA [Planctomycetota bacterium]|nr:chromosomal replication initiator protein DnaA [Planctomycetota bacterium]